VTAFRAGLIDRLVQEYVSCRHTFSNHMARKNITIDLEAYERLRSVRRENESFSQAIKRLVKAPFDVKAFCRQKDTPLIGDVVAATRDRPPSSG